MAGKLNFNPAKRIHRNGRVEWRIVVGYRKNKSGNFTPEYLTCKNEAHAKSEQKRLIAEQATSDDLGIEAIKTANKHSVASIVAKLAAVGATIEEAGEYFLANRFAKKGDCTASDALADYLGKSIKGNISESSLEAYETKVLKISGYFGNKLINSITTEDLEAMFDDVGKHWNNNTMHQWKRFTITVWNWFGKQGYVAQKTEHAASRLVIPKRDIETPRMSNVNEVHHMLYWFDAFAKKVGGYKRPNTYDCIVYLLLCLFLGIRKSEAYAITWDDIDFNNRTVSVLIEGSKTDRRRVNELPDNVWNWFAYLRDKAPLDSSGDPQRRLFARLRKYRESFSKQGKPVPDIVATEMKQTTKGIEPKEKYHNIMRHTMCAFHYKCFGSAGLTASIMGNSEKKVRSDYYEVVKSKQEAELYFRLNPPVILTEEEMKKYSKEDFDKEETQKELRAKAVEAYIHQEMLNQFIEEHADMWKHYDRIIKAYTLGSASRMQDVWHDAEWRTDPDVTWVDGSPMYTLKAG